MNTNIPGFDLERRECGDCHVCCITPQIDLEPALGQHFQKAARARCPYLDDHSRGCLIYEQRGQVCRGFLCLWMRGALGLGNRPDKLGVLLNILDLDPITPCLVATEIRLGAFGEPLVQWLIGELEHPEKLGMLVESTGLLLRCHFEGQTTWTGVEAKVDRAVMIQRAKELQAAAEQRAKDEAP